MINIIEFAGERYPKFQSEGFAAKFAFPFALEVCKGHGLDIGCNRLEWCLPTAYPIDPTLSEFDALNIPKHNEIYKEAGNETWDFIFSSHCLEHIVEWVSVLDYWREQLRSGGVLFLYLPHPDQKYWHPWNNRKHVNILHPQDIERYLNANGFKNVFVSGRDLNHSFMAMAEKI